VRLGSGDDPNGTADARVSRSVITGGVNHMLGARAAYLGRWICVLAQRSWVAARRSNSRSWCWRQVHKLPFGKVFKILCLTLQMKLLYTWDKLKLNKGERTMGFDLYSLGNHKSSKGEYFRNNVWWWRRLADFVCEHTGCVEEKDKSDWQMNNGHEVSSDLAKQIAKQLRALIDNGTVDKAIKEVEQEMEKAETNNKQVDKLHQMLRAKVEQEVGNKNIAPADYPEEDHKTWDWIQSKYSYGSSYPFTRKNVENFIEFCEESNGFTIA
jgi:hypothetical protein